MNAKPVVPRAEAHADAERAIDHYIAETGADVALTFIDALELTYTFIGEAPGVGSPRWATELNLPGLRTIRLKGFPWLVFYTDTETHIDVWRVLHTKRDIPVWMDVTEQE